MGFHLAGPPQQTATANCYCFLPLPFRQEIIAEGVRPRVGCHSEARSIERLFFKRSPAPKPMRIKLLLRIPALITSTEVGRYSSPAFTMALRSRSFSVSKFIKSNSEGFQDAPMRNKAGTRSSPIFCWKGFWIFAPTQTSGKTRASILKPKVAIVADPYSCAEARNTSAEPPT